MFWDRINQYVDKYIDRICNFVVSFLDILINHKDQSWLDDVGLQSSIYKDDFMFDKYKID